MFAHVYPTKYAQGFVSFRVLWLYNRLLVELRDVFTYHIHRDVY